MTEKSKSGASAASSPQGKASGSKASGMKSAYELALERLDREGIERPREEALSEATRQAMAGVRRKAEADLAQAEILHRDRLRQIYEPEKRRQEQENYVLERRRIEAERDRRIEKLRSGEDPA